MGRMGIQERKEREKEHRREEILEAARGVFFRKGLLSSTMDEIAEKAELSKATLYLYFKSKEDLYSVVALRGLEILEEIFRKVSAEDLPAIPTLLQFIEAFERFFETERNYFRLFTFFQTPQFHADVSSQLRESCIATNHRIWTSVIDVLRRGITEGVIRGDVDPKDVAIIAMSGTTALMQRIDTELDRWREKMGIDLQKTLRVSNRLLLQAVLTDEGRRALAGQESADANRPNTNMP